jgi:hypothetical protein
VRPVRELLTPLNFVSAEQPIWPEIGEGAFDRIGAAELRQRCMDGFTCWTLQTFVIMRQAGLEPTLSRLPQEGCVNVVHPLYFGLRHRDLSSYLLACRADTYAPWAANHHLEQNGTRGVSPRRSWVPIWPQPGLVPRDPARGNRIETLVFKGEELNLDARFRCDAFRAALGELGVTLRLDVFAQAAGGGVTLDWHDYSTADLVLAARNLTREDAAGKPASKLVNAWSAGVPALLGPEPAFREQRQSELDYIEVRTPLDVLAALRSLRDVPETYEAMIENGRQRAADFTTAAILDRWLKVLNGPVRAHFLRWQDKSALARAAFIVPSLVRDRLAKRAYLRDIQAGERILDAGE